MPPSLPLVKDKPVNGWFELVGLDLKRADVCRARGNFGGCIGFFVPLDAYVARYPGV